MKYTELKDNQSKQLEDFVNKNAFFAFNQEQFNEGLAKFPKNTKFLNCPAGMFLKETKLEEYKSLHKKFENELDEAMKTFEFAKSAFKYEMHNHEMGYCWDNTLLFGVLNLTEDEVSNNPMQLKAFEQAKKEYYQEVEL